MAAKLDLFLPAVSTGVLSLQLRQRILSIVIFSSLLASLRRNNIDSVSFQYASQWSGEYFTSLTWISHSACASVTRSFTIWILSLCSFGDLPAANNFLFSLSFFEYPQWHNRYNGVRPISSCEFIILGRTLRYLGPALRSRNFTNQRLPISQARCMTF